ncbi:MAG: hypothetical protein ACE5E1_08975 [Phycisphaerae bacterium]
MRQVVWVLPALLTAGAIVTAQSILPDPPGQSSVEETVLRRIKQQPVGSQTLDALGLPDAFLRRVGDRIIRMSYQQRFRVVGEPRTAPAGPPQTAVDRQAPETNAAPRWSQRLYLAGGCLTAAAVVCLLLLRRRRRRVTS